MKIKKLLSILCLVAAFIIFTPHVVTPIFAEQPLPVVNKIKDGEYPLEGTYTVGYGASQPILFFRVEMVHPENNLYRIYRNDRQVGEKPGIQVEHFMVSYYLIYIRRCNSGSCSCDTCLYDMGLCALDLFPTCLCTPCLCEVMGCSIL